MCSDFRRAESGTQVRAAGSGTGAAETRAGEGRATEPGGRGRRGGGPGRGRAGRSAEGRRPRRTAAPARPSRLSPRRRPAALGVAGRAWAAWRGRAEAEGGARVAGRCAPPAVGWPRGAGAVPGYPRSGAASRAAEAGTRRGLRADGLQTGAGRAVWEQGASRLPPRGAPAARSPACVSGAGRPRTRRLGQVLRGFAQKRPGRYPVRPACRSPVTGRVRGAEGTTSARRTSGGGRRGGTAAFGGQRGALVRGAGTEVLGAA